MGIYGDVTNQWTDTSRFNYKDMLVKVYISGSVDFPCLKSRSLFCQVGYIVSFAADMYICTWSCFRVAGKNDIIKGKRSKYTLTTKVTDTPLLLTFILSADE